MPPKSGLDLSFQNGLSLHFYISRRLLYIIITLSMIVARSCPKRGTGSLLEFAGCDNKSSALPRKGATVPEWFPEHGCAVCRCTSQISEYA